MTIAEQFKAEGIQQGIQQEVEKGIEQEKIIIAERLLSEGAEISFIAKITNLSLAKIKELKEKSH